MDDVVKKADDAMYSAKKTGKNKVYFESLDESSSILSDFSRVKPWAKLKG